MNPNHLEKINDVDINYSRSESPADIAQNTETAIQIVGPELSDLPPPDEYIPRRDPVNRFLNRSWITKCCNTSDSSESDEVIVTQSYSEEAPPPYSSIFRRPRPNCNNTQLPFLPVDNHSSFEVHTPPPSYAQSQGICMDSFSMDHLISVTSSNARFLTSQPTFAICPRCGLYISTIVEIYRSRLASVITIVLFMSGCCCIIPYCVNSNQTVHHYCSICRSYIGTYTP